MIKNNCKNCRDLKNGSIIKTDIKGNCVFCGRNVQDTFNFQQSNQENNYEVSRTFLNESGNILVRFCSKKTFGRCGIVEILHLYDHNKSGCVIGAWEVRDVDGEKVPEFKVVHDRLTSIKYSFDVLEALKFGQKLAEDSIYYDFDTLLG